MSKPSVLVLGGTGFVGRHMVKYLVANDLASKIRVADKQLPQTSYFNKEFEDVFKNPIVEFKQANLTNESHRKKIFDEAFDYVINLAGETKFGQNEEVYDQMVHQLSTLCGKAAAEKGCKKFIEVSTAQVYKPKDGKKGANESDKLKPWTNIALYKEKAEEDLKKVAGLPLIVLRPATIYGPADLNGLAPRIICAATYKVTKDKMKLLWGGDLKVNTVHVTDVVRAIWHCCVNVNAGSVFNLADKSDTDQKKLNTFFEPIFGIETDFYGNMISNLAKLNLGAVVDEANDKHMAPWSDLCKQHNINFTPLSPYIDKELLYNNSLYIDGSAIESTGFKYEVPEITKNHIMEEIQYFTELKLFPPII